MNPILEKILLEIIKKLISDEVVLNAKKHLVEFLSMLAKQSDNKIDDYMVSVIAEALGVPYEAQHPKVDAEPHNNS